MKSNRKDIHENYHKKTRMQYKFIKENNFTYRHTISVLKSSLNKKMNILDIGCGAGTVDFYLANKGYNVTGIDISEKAISSCNETKKYLGLKKVFFQQSYFPKDKIKGKYDFVIFSEVIEHLDEDEKALKEINKLLNPGGILFLSTPSINAPLHKLGLTKQFDKDVGHVRRYSQERLQELLDKTGFNVKEIKINEGIVRNFLFINPIAGKLVRFIKFFVSDLVTLVDNITVPIFGGANWIVIARKA